MASYLHVVTDKTNPPFLKKKEKKDPRGKKLTSMLKEEKQ